MAEIPAGNIGHSTEVFLYTGDQYRESRSVFADATRSTGSNSQPDFFPPGRGEPGTYGWRGYTNQPANFAKIGRIRDISGPEPGVNEVEVTSNDSPDNYKEFIPGLKDGGTVSFDAIYDVRDASQTGSQANSLEQMFEDQEVRRFAIRVPVYRIGDRISDIAGNKMLLDGASPGYVNSGGYDDRPNSINRFRNQAFHLFQGFVMRLGNEIPMEEAIMRSVEIKVTGRVKSPSLAVAESFPTQAARYVAMRGDSTTPVAADFNGVDPQTSNLVRVPAYTAVQWISIALPATESDPTDFKMEGEPTSRIARFRKRNAVTIGGVQHNVWQSRQSLTLAQAQSYIEIIQ